MIRTTAVYDMMLARLLVFICVAVSCRVLLYYIRFISVVLSASDYHCYKHSRTFFVIYLQVKYLPV